MALYSVLKVIHGGIVHKNTQDLLLLAQNKYLVIPTVNVDGLVYIEQQYKATGDLPVKRSNMHIQR